MHVLFKSPGYKLPSCYVRVDVVHLFVFATTWKSLNNIQVRRRVKEFYVRAIGQLVKATDLYEAKFLIKTIFIVMLSEYKGEINDLIIIVKKQKKSWELGFLMESSNILSKVRCIISQMKVLQKKNVLIIKKMIILLKFKSG